jgi:hypothetical protein
MENSELIVKFTGIASLLLFVLANAYYPARLIANRFRPWSEEVVLFFKKYLDIHMWMNVMAFALMTINAYLSNDRTIFIYASLLVTIWLTLAGVLKRSKKISGDTHKQTRLLHTQQTIFVVWLVLLTWGIL